MTSSPAHIVLAAFTDADRTDTAEMGAVVPIGSGRRHPEGAATPCQHAAPEPCWEHDAAGRPVTARAPELPREEADAYVPAVVARMTAPTVCQCVAPDPCTTHPDDRPWIARPPASAIAHPNGAVGRIERRREPGGALLEVEARSRLPKFADEDLLLLHRLHQAELRRRGLHTRALS